MPQIYFSRIPTTPFELVGDEPEALSEFCAVNQLSPSSGIAPGRAYSFDVEDPQTPHILVRLNAMPSAEKAVIVEGIASSGGKFNAVARFFEDNLTPEKLDRLNGLVGAGAAAANARLTGFQRALVDYEKALLDVNKASRSHSVGGGVRLYQAETRAKLAYERMQHAYQAELNRVSDPSLRLKNRGNALSNAPRGITLSKRSPNSAKVDPGVFVSGLEDVRRFGLYARMTHIAGNLAVGVSAALAAEKVVASRAAGGDWLRESSRQMTKFGTGGAIGGYAGKWSATVTTSVGGRAIGALASKGVIVGAGKVGLMAAGPIGWGMLAVAVGVGLVVGWQVGERAGASGEALADRLWSRSTSW